MRKVVALEGPDGSGKGTQAELLYRRLVDEGYVVAYLDFPRYDEFIGREIGKRLAGNARLDAKQLPPEDFSLWYAVDRQLAFNEVAEDVEIIIMNRSTYSNVGYQLTRVEADERAELKRWLEQLEFEVLGVPKPDKVFFLDVPLHISQELVRQKGEREYIDKPDKYESDMQMMETAHQIYTQLATTEPNFEVVACVEGEELRSMDSIHEELFRRLCDYLNATA